MMRRILIFLCSALALQAEARSQRSTEVLASCMEIADPLIHNPNFIFPQKIADIRAMCQRWDGFVNCIRKYTTTFWSTSQQEGFDKAINPSMHSIHQLCVEDEQYERAYLYYAPCMKKISIERNYCGTYYNRLAEAVKTSEENGPTICCSYHKFRSCTLEASRECERNDDPTRPTFGTGDSTGNSVSSMLNGALGYLHQKCSDYEPTSQDCASLKPEINLGGFGFPKPSVSRGRDGRVVHETNPVPNNDLNDDGAGGGGRPANSAWSRPTNNFPSESSGNGGNDVPASLDSPKKYKPHVTVYTPSSNKDQFTWTTVTPSLFPTRGLLGPESQQYRGNNAVSLTRVSSVYVNLLVLASLASTLFPTLLGSSYLVKR